MKPRTLIALVGLICLAVAPAHGSSIGVFFAPDGSDCDANVQIFTPVNWYILANLYGDAASAGITGAEFSQHGTPSGWIVSWTANPAANVNIIHPGGIEVGASIAFPTCQTAIGGVVLLYTANGFAMSQVGPTCLWIDAHQSPIVQPAFPCLNVFLCDSPTFTRLCVNGGAGTINASCNGPSCSVGLQPAPWTKIKSLYQ
jgi:hypothetical protein